MRHYYFLLTYVVLLLNACSSDTKPVEYSDDKSDIKADNLVDPNIAHDLLLENPESYILIHVSKKEAYAKEHLPNAINIWRPDYGCDHSEPFGGLIPSREKLEALLQSFGFADGKTLLIYDLKANVDALRFAWVLQLYGFDDFKIISGGLKYWKLSGLEVTNEKSEAPQKSNYQLQDYFDESMIANYGDVRSAINDTNTIIIDTREEYEYLGEPFKFKDSILGYKIGAFDRGSIPTAIHLNWSNFADLKGDHRIKAENDLRHDLKIHGVDEQKNIILYCQSGSRTSHTFYVLKSILGFQNVKNYDGSWLEWSYYSTLDEQFHLSWFGVEGTPIVQFVSDERFMEMKDSLNLMLDKN